VKLTYRDLPATVSGVTAVVLHDRGAASADRMAGLVQASGAAGRVVAPFGDYGFTASGMELAGICWYRTVPGFAAPDPLSLSRAVVQVGDLLDELDLDGPALLGWGQGAVVALGAGLLQPDRVTSVTGIDAPAAHIEALPARLLAAERRPPVLLLRTTADGTTATGRTTVTGGTTATDGSLAGESTLADHGITCIGWNWPGGDDGDRDKAMAERIGRWLGDD
jgi:pimeloyl-ACP methyl ester carboxylesterase